MKNLIFWLPVAFALMGAMGYGADGDQYVVGVNGMT